MLYEPLILLTRYDQRLWKKLKRSQNRRFLPKTGNLRDGAVKYTGRLPRILPLVFRELSRALSCFPRVGVGLFVHVSNSEDVMTFHKKKQDLLFLAPVLTINNSLFSEPPEKTDRLLHNLN